MPHFPKDVTRNTYVIHGAEYVFAIPVEQYKLNNILTNICWGTIRRFGEMQCGCGCNLGDGAQQRGLSVGYNRRFLTTSR